MQSNAKTYISTDYMGEFEAMKRLDIEAIDEPDNHFDIVICYHVLEHIKADKKAMSELFRILKPNGACYIQTPFKEGDIYEDDSITTEEERFMYFGQKDHLRIYSVQGLVNRLERVGFITEVLNLKNHKDNVDGFIENETVIIAKKA
nr:methyltransferase domain-containing protein [uncultured Psychroserpens sp.]